MSVETAKYDGWNRIQQLKAQMEHHHQRYLNAQKQLSQLLKEIADQKCTYQSTAEHATDTQLPTCYIDTSKKPQRKKRRITRHHTPSSKREWRPIKCTVPKFWSWRDLRSNQYWRKRTQQSTRKAITPAQLEKLVGSQKMNEQALNPATSHLIKGKDKITVDHTKLSKHSLDLDHNEHIFNSDAGSQSSPVKDLRAKFERLNSSADMKHQIISLKEKLNTTVVNIEEDMIKNIDIKDARSIVAAAIKESLLLNNTFDKIMELPLGKLGKPNSFADTLYPLFDKVTSTHSVPRKSPATEMTHIYNCWRSMEAKSPPAK